MATTDQAAWEHAVYAAAKKLRETYPSLGVGDRLESAIVLVRDGHVSMDEDHIGHVVSRTQPNHVWKVNGKCACPDAEHAPSGRCAHRIAVGLYRQVRNALEQRETAQLPQTPLPEPESTTAAVHNVVRAFRRDEQEGLTPPGTAASPAPQAPCPEAAFSLCLKGFLDGADAQITVRGQTAADFLANVQAVRGLLIHASPHPAPPQAPPAGPVGLAPVPPPMQPPVQATGLEGTLTFMCDSLVGTFDAERDKTFWRVKGAKFSKHGVNVWPEVLEAAGFAAGLAAQVYSLHGWQAQYILKEGGQSPDKVVHLIKPA